MKDKSTLVTSSQTEAKLAGNAMTAPATYTAKGLLNGLKTDMGSSNILRNYTYNFNSGNGNLKSRTFSNKIQTAVTETFAYDSLYRLTSVTGSNAMTITYGSGADNAKVNIYSKTGLGAYTYHPTKVHAVNSIATNPGYVLQQNVTYTDFNKAKTITYGDYLLDVVYGPDRQRVKSVLKKNNSIIKTVIFAGNYERITKNDTVIHLYYIAGGDGLCGIHVKQTKGSAAISDGMYYVHPDHLGSLTVITDAAGNIKQQSRFDAWGQREFVYKDPTLVFDRGFTGHEHLDEFGLINMNARLYDPMLGRFLSPDPYVPNPNYGQDYNRYTYARNNPLIYTDPDGEWIHLVIGAIIGGTANVIANWKKIDGNFWKGVGYFGVGAAAGALGAGVGAGVSSMLPVSGSVSGGFAAGFWGTTAATTATSSFVTGVAIGGAAGFSSGFTTGFGNGLLGGQNFGQALWSGAQGGFWGVVSGAALGGLFSGYDAIRDNRNFWTGEDQGMGRSLFAFNNSDLDPTHYRTKFGYEPNYSIDRTGPVVHSYDERVLWGTGDRNSISNGAISRRDNYLLPGEELNYSLTKAKGRVNIQFGSVPEGGQIQVLHNGKIVQTLGAGSRSYSGFIPANVSKLTVKYLYTPSADYFSGPSIFRTTIRAFLP